MSDDEGTYARYISIITGSRLTDYSPVFTCFALDLLHMSNRVSASFRTLILVGVLFQNAGYTLLRKYSNLSEDVSSKEILFMGELIKVVVAGYLTLQNSVTRQEESSAQGIGMNRLIWLVKHSGKMLVLAMIYAAMNILSFISLQYIGAGEFTICAQLKILTTAGFSVLILGRSLTTVKWISLGQLVLGCILVASPTFTNTKPVDLSVDVESAKAEQSAQAFLQLIGFGAVLTEVVLSGFASIYFEKVVKSTTEVVTIWERNFQLGLYSMVMYGCIIVYEGNAVVGENWTMLTFTVSAFGAIGGLLVAATLKYADSILKTLAAAGAIVVSTVLGHYLLDGPFTIIVCIGATTTILSICSYAWDPTPSLQSSNSSPSPNVPGSGSPLLRDEEKGSRSSSK